MTNSISNVQQLIVQLLLQVGNVVQKDLLLVYLQIQVQELLEFLVVVGEVEVDEGLQQFLSVHQILHLQLLEAVHHHQVGVLVEGFEVTLVLINDVILGVVTLDLGLDYSTLVESNQLLVELVQEVGVFLAKEVLEEFVEVFVVHFLEAKKQQSVPQKSFVGLSFMLEKDVDQVHNPDLDGLSLEFLEIAGQKLVVLIDLLKHLELVRVVLDEGFELLEGLGLQENDFVSEFLREFLERDAVELVKQVGDCDELLDVLFVELGELLQLLILEVVEEVV